MNRILLKKAEDITDPGPWWLPWVGRAYVRCGGTCGERMLLEHDIRDNGEVYPSVVCPMADCDWHVWVTLEGWEP